MFSPSVYKARRQKLREQMGSGLAIIFGNTQISRNYAGNVYPFRQDSNFLYFFGTDLPGFIGVVDCDGGKDYLIGSDLTVDEIVWMGNWPTVADHAGECGADAHMQTSEFKAFLDKHSANKKHLLPPYSPYRTQWLLQYFTQVQIEASVSETLIKAVVNIRSVKEAREIEDMENTLSNITFKMYESCVQYAKKGVSERFIVGEIASIALKYGEGTAYPSIVTRHGEILHNEHYNGILQSNDLLLVDAGAESAEHYATDITRTYPVDGKFEGRQKEVYSIVLEAQKKAIAGLQPGVPNRDIHLETAFNMASGLKEMGLMKGDIRQAVEQGAHALFYPHGLGHMIGLDVHDMEDLGEDFVGYNDAFVRSTQFGTANLRLGRRLQENFVVTVEPGLYFIPALIDAWKADKKFENFICYNEVEKFKDFGGIRIEDDVLITASGSRVLGTPIPKEIDEITV